MKLLSHNFVLGLSLIDDPRLHSILSTEIDRIPHELLGDTELLVIEAGDREEEIVHELGWSPLVEPVDELRFGHAGFSPHWDWLSPVPGWGFRMVACYGSTFATVIFIEDAEGVIPELRAMCRTFSGVQSENGI